jgi:hypothetical protein
VAISVVVIMGLRPLSLTFVEYEDGLVDGI